MKDPLRRLGAATVALTLAALVGCDLWIQRFRSWWDRHSLTGSVVSNLLALAVAGLIVDEVVARRERKRRAVSVAVQALIVYTQARHAYDAVTAAHGETTGAASVSEELRSLASMLLTASSSLFDDPVARQFLSQVERFSASMFRAISVSTPDGLADGDGDRLASAMSQLRQTVEPLMARIPTSDRSLFEDSS